MDRLPSVNSYMKNLGKSIKYVAINEIRDTIPIVFETKESNEEAISSIRSSFRNKNKLKTISNIAKDSEFYKSGNELYKNLKSSIKTGSFYSQKRQDKADNDFMRSFMGGDLDFDDDFKVDDSEGDLNDESEEALNQNADALNELNDDLNSGFEASATAISNTTVESARYVGETVKASAAMAYAQNNEQTYLMRTGFKSLDDGLKKLVSFNSDILQKHIQNSTTFFDNTSKLLNEQNAMMKEMLEMQRNVYKANQATENKTSFNKYADIVSSSGVVNISEYFKNVKSNFAEWSEPIMMLLNMMKANPLEMVIQGGLSFLGSDSMKRAGSDLNKTLSGVFGKYLSFIEKQAKKNGGIWDTLNDIFGVRNRNKTDIDTGLYEKGPMQFNGIANKAITEVIPGYLARIESALTGGEERYFNFNNGRWTNTRKIRNEYNKKLNSSAENTGLSDLFTEIGSSLNRVNYDNYGGVKISSKDKNDLLNLVMSTIVKNNGDIDDSFIVKSKKGHNYSDMKTFYKIFGFKESELTKSQKAMLNIIATALANTSTSTRASLNNTVRQAKGSTAQFKQSIEDDQYNISRVLVNGALSGSRFVEDAVPYSEGSMDTLESYKESVPVNSTTSSTKKNKKGKNKKSANINPINKVMTATSTSHINFAKQIFYSVSTIDEFIEMHNSADVPAVKKMIGYISGLKNITELNERSDAIVEFETMVKRLDSADFLECKQYEKFIEYVKNKDITSVGKSGLFTDLTSVAKNFFTFVYSLISKDNITTSEGLAKSVDDAHSYKREFSYDKYEGKGLFDKLDKAKGIDKLGVLMGYTKKLTSMPFDVLGAVIAKTDRVIYDMFFGNDQREDSSGKKITGFFHLMTSKIGDAVDSLYKEVKNRIWGKEQWNQYKDIVYNDFSSIIKKGKSFFSNGDEEDSNEEESSDNNTEETTTKTNNTNTKKRRRKSKLKRKRAKRKKIRGAAFGLGMVPETDVYTLHKGEAVIPAYMNPEYTGSDIDPEKHAKDEANVAKKYGLSVKGYAKGTVKDESKEEKREKESMLAWLKRTYPAALGEGTVGGILGTIVAGPLGLVGGAALGAANYVLKNSTTANKFLFGDTDKKSLFTRTKSGLKKILPKSITNFFEEQDKKVRDIGKMSIAGGTLGLIGGAIGGPFGLMGGLMLGGAVGVLKNYEGAQKLVFGNHDVKGKLDSISSKKYLKSVGLGALAGGILGGPFGMLGGAMLGVAGQFASESDTFKNFMFGELDEKTGKRKYKEGFLGKIGEKIISPLGTLKDDIIHYMDANVFQPISRAFVPLTRYTQLGMRGLFKKIQKGLDAIVNPSMKLRWYQNLPTIMKGPAGRYIGHGLAGAAGGFMYGGPMGAILGGVLGGASAIKFKDKTIASWLGKGAAWLGTKPGKILDFGTRRLNKKLIAKGNMDSISMSAKDRVDFMEKNDYAYDDARYKENDIALRDSSVSQLQAMKNTIEISKMLSDKSGKNRTKIEGKVREAVKSIPNLDYSSMQKILKFIRNAIKSDKPEATTKAMADITNLLRERGLDDNQIEQYLKPIRLGISGLSSNKMVQDSLQKDLNNRNKYLKKTYGFNIVNGDIDKALEQVDSEIQSREKNGETVEKESLDKGDAAIVQSTNKVNDSIKISNLYLSAIMEHLKYGKITDKTSKALNEFVGSTPLVQKSESDDKAEDETMHFSQKTGTMIKMTKTSDGGYKPDTTDKDTKEAIEKADAERTAILTLGEYAKSKLKGTKKSIKNRVSKFANSAVFGGIKDIFKSLFGMPFGIVGDILGMIPGASLLKGKLTRFAGDKLSKWSSKLSSKAEKWGKAGSVLGKIGGKVGKFGGFLLKNMADAATAAADAEESTPEFQTELEAFNYMARKISGVEAAIVAKAESVDQGINNFLPDTLTSPGTIKRTIDPKTGKPVATRNGQGFFGGLWNKTKSGVSKVWNGLKTGVKAVSSKAMAAVGPVLGWVQNGLKKVFDFAAKFLPSNIGNKISSFGSTILKKVSNPKVAVKVAEKAASKGIQLGLGPIGWAFIAGSIAVSFYQGYNNAETIWNNGSENKNEDLSMGDKAICGICSVVSNELLFGIISPSEVLDIAKSIFGKIKGITDTIKDKASNIMSTISGYKDKLLNAGKEMWNKVKTSLGKTWDNIKDSVGNAIQGIKDTFDKFKKIGISTLAELLKHPIDWITNKAKSLFDNGSGDTKPTTPSVTTYTDTRKKKVISANTSDKVDPNADPDHGIGTGLATAVEQPKTPDLNVDPDKGIGTQDAESVEDKLNKYRKEQQEANSTPSWKDKFNGVYVRGVGMIPTGGPLSGDSLRRYRLSSIGGGDMTPEGIWNLLTTKYHYSNQAAAAIMGSMQQESSFDPNASQHGGGIEASIAAGDGENGFGLCQWTGSRTQALVNFCNSNGLDPTTVEGQVAFMNYEMGQRGSNAAFNSADSVDAACKVMKDYEGYGEIGNREVYAQQIFQNQGKGLTSAGSASGGSSSGNKSNADDSVFGKIDQLFNKAFAPFNSIFGNLFGDSDSSSSNGSSSSSGGGAGSAASDMSGTIDSGSTADKLLSSLKAEANGDASVSAPYGEQNHMGHTHGGIDIAVPAGTPIKSPISGTVIDNREGGGYGYYVQIKDKNNMDHLFPHMESPSPLEQGSQVSEGDVVGYVGSTGNSTGPHVHYEIDDDAVNQGAEVSKPHINPGKYMGGPLSGDSTLRFRKKVNDLANAGNRAAIKALKKGYGSDNIGVGGPTDSDNLANINIPNNNSNIVVKDYSDQLNTIISLLGVIASAVQTQVATAGANTTTANLQGQVNNTMGTTTPNTSILNIMKSMLNIASH